MSTCHSRREKFFFAILQYQQLLICNAYCVFEYGLSTFYLLSVILPTSGLELE
jgi:hypothetical protein